MNTIPSFSKNMAWRSTFHQVLQSNYSFLEGLDRVLSQGAQR